MLFVYALAAVVSLAVAWLLKVIYAGVRMQKARAEARPKPGQGAPDKAD